MNYWEQIKQALSRRLKPEGFRIWIQPAALDRIEGDALWVNVPNEAAKEFIEREYAETIRQVVAELGLPFTVVLRAPAPQIEEALMGAESQSAGETAFSPANPMILNPKFSFDSFVVGSCNQFAHAAARAVANMPSKAYNPLFIYGGTGMGKTHLMHAIGRQLAQDHASIRLVYTTSEKFVNQMIQSIKLDRIKQFQEHYRGADVLLVDDVQFLGGKERTQEEFFHTFNELFDHQKQIVLSSDQPPKNTPGLVERLRSRFEWGLIVDVQAPDLETKMAILEKKTEAYGLELPQEVRIFIATKTKSNVRELEGALVKLVAYSSVSGTPITLEMAHQVLKHLTQNSERRVTMDLIMRVVCEHFTLQVSQLKLKSNERRFVYPRQIAMWLCKELTQSSLPEIGRTFGSKHHTTVLHSITKIEQMRQRDPDLDKLLHMLIDRINA
jgi:chromosomal replication initiator protein